MSAINPVISFCKSPYGQAVIQELLRNVTPQVVEYVKNELASDDPFGLVTGGRTGRAYDIVVTYIKNELHSNDPFGLITGGRAARIFKKIFSHSS